MLNKKKNNKGFTLVELLVVIAIIGVLAVVAVPALFKNIEKSKVAELEADISAIKTASLAYYGDNSNYPKEATIGKTTTNGTTTNNTGIEDDIEGLANPFKGAYILDGTVPGPLTLTIDLHTDSDATKLSKDGAKKLIKDLGNVSNVYLVGTPDTAVPVTAETVISKDVVKVDITIINGEN